MNADKTPTCGRCTVHHDPFNRVQIVGWVLGALLGLLLLHILTGLIIHPTQQAPNIY